MPVLPEKREAGGFVREGAFYNGFAGCVPAKFPSSLREFHRACPHEIHGFLIVRGGILSEKSPFVA